jgi:GNAT superfamily N-acetyltransferase
MRIAIATTANTSDLVDLHCELYEYYNPDQRADRATISSHLSNTLLATNSELSLAMALYSNEKVVGIAAIHFVHSVVDPTPGGRKQCVLKELFVSESHRGKNVGTQLMIWVAKHAVQNGCGRMDWNVKASNVNGIAFYTALGARKVEDRMSYRLDRFGLATLSNRVPLS